LIQERGEKEKRDCVSHIPETVPFSHAQRGKKRERERCFLRTHIIPGKKGEKKEGW